MAPLPQDVTQLLAAWRGGDQAAFDRLIPLVYDELRRLAHRYLRRERPDHTLQTTALVHEAYLRLMDQKHTDWQNRAHFFAVAAKVMRHLLVDYARGRDARGRGGWRKVELEEAALVAWARGPELLALDEALTRLAALDPQKAEVVELRHFGGLTAKEIAAVLGLAEMTVHREWQRAKLWLYRELRQGEGDDA